MTVGAYPTRSASPGRRWAWRAAWVLPLLAGPLGVWTAQAVPTLDFLGKWNRVIALALVLVCAVTDLSRRKIPNWATYPAFLWGVGINVFAALAAWSDPVAEEYRQTPWWQVLGPVGLIPCLAGAVACFLALLILYRLSGGGAGDVKLATALGALLGLEQAVEALVFSYLAAGVGILCWLIWSVGPVRLLQAVARKFGSILWPARIAPPSVEARGMLEAKIPLGLFFAIGTLAVLVGGRIPW